MVVVQPEQPAAAYPVNPGGYTEIYCEIQSFILEPKFINQLTLKPSEYPDLGVLVMQDLEPNTPGVVTQAWLQSVFVLNRFLSA